MRSGENARKLTRIPAILRRKKSQCPPVRQPFAICSARCAATDERLDPAEIDSSDAGDAGAVGGERESEMSDSLIVTGESGQFTHSPPVKY